MTQIYDENGNTQPVTLIDTSFSTVTQILKKDKQGYNGVQVGIGKKNLTKPMRGHLKEFVSKEGKGFAFLREFRIDEVDSFKHGDKLKVDQFELGEKLTVRGITKGKGFQGVVKRWGFAGGRASHGGKGHIRTPGSIGSAFPQRVLKGLKMAGHMGTDKKSAINLKLVYMDKENNIIGVKGAFPGNNGGYLEITTRK